MSLEPTMQTFKTFIRARSIRWKLAVTFLALASAIVAFVGVVISIHIETVDLAARMEAGHVAELIADAAVEDGRVKGNLQEYVAHLTSAQKRDLVVVDVAKLGLADADPGEVGKVYDHDLGNEVGQTIRDGRTRSFIEKKRGPSRRRASNRRSAAAGQARLEHAAGGGSYPGVHADSR